MKSQTRKPSIQTLTFGAVLTALIIILQFMGSFIRFGPFSISLVLIPIVIGAATCGAYMGAWLGFVFGVVVLISGDAAAFLTVNVPGTIITVLLKGTACGFCAGLIYKALAKFNRYVGVVAGGNCLPACEYGRFPARVLAVLFRDSLGVGSRYGIWLKRGSLYVSWTGRRQLLIRAWNQYGLKSNYCKTASNQVKGTF